MKHKIIIHNDNVIHYLIFYKGQVFHGKSKCHPTDTFNKETGIKIAKVRAEEKLAKAKLAYAKERYNVATDFVRKSYQELKKASELLIKANDFFKENQSDLEKLDF